MKRRLMWTFILFLLITLTLAAPSENIPKRNLANVQEGAAITALTKDQINPAVAFNHELDEYIVVFEHVFSPTDHDIYARRVSSEGIPIGSEVSITESGKFESNPVAAYNFVDNEYLVVWEYEYSSTDHDIYAQRVRGDGKPIDSMIIISDLSNFESNPAVSFNPNDNEFLITWEHREFSGEFVQHDIYGQRLDTNGIFVGSSIPIAIDFQDERAPAVAYDSINHQYFVVWQDKQTEEYKIRGRQLSSNGSPLGSEVSISTWEYDQIKPRLAFNSKANEFLIVWEDHHWGGGNDRDIYGQRIRADGILVGGNFGISWEGEKHRKSPDVAYNDVANEYLVIWEYEWSPDDNDLYRRRIGSDGSLLEDETVISNEYSHERQPALASDSVGSYLLVWEDGRDAITQGMNIYGDTVHLNLFSGYVLTRNMSILFENTTEYNVESMVSGDYNGDGYADMVFGTGTSGLVYVSYGSGSSSGLGGWTLLMNTTEEYILSMASGDYNNDGNVDMAFGTGYNGLVYVSYGSSSGLSNPVQLMDTGEYEIGSMSSGDYDSDGYEDMVFGTGYGGLVYVSYGSQSGLVSPILFRQSGETEINSISSGDYNGDGNVDMTFGTGYNGLVYVSYGSSSGLDIPTLLEDTTEDYVDSMSSGDYNGDGYEDMAFGTCCNGFVYVSYGSLSGLNSPAQIIDTTEYNAYSMTAGYYNDDNYVDMAFGTTTNGQVYITYGFISGLGKPALFVDTEEDYILSMTSGDYNGDGIDDMTYGTGVVSEDSGKIYAFQGFASEPLVNVTVGLYCSSNTSEFGFLIATTVTDSLGRYGLPVSDVCDFYNIAEADPIGYMSAGATSEDGIVINDNWIQYESPLESKILKDNMFWDSFVIEDTLISTRMLTADRDTYVTALYSFSNFGSEPELMIRESDPEFEVYNEAVALLWFNTSDMLNRTKIKTAYLNMLLNETYGSNQSMILVHAVEDKWDEMNVTWQNQPSYTVNPVTFSKGFKKQERHIFWDITPLVQQWIKDPMSNHGIALSVQTEDITGASRIFGSRESDTPPKLTLTYTMPSIEWPEPSPTPIPPHEKITLPVSDTAYLRWDSYEYSDLVREDPGSIILSVDNEQFIQERRLLKFTLPPVLEGAEIYDARLELYLENGENPKPISIVANMMTIPWNETDASWASTFWAANEETDAPHGMTRVELVKSRWVSLDVTRHVKKWVYGRSSNNGFQLGGSDGTDKPWSRVFAGRNAGSNAPRLIILYAPKSSFNGSSETSYAGQSDLPSPIRPDLCPLWGAQMFASGAPGFPTRRNWGIISPMEMVRGIAMGTSISHHEWPATHDDHDFVFKIPKNEDNAWAMGGGNPNEIEIEWEHQVWPMWAWPTDGDEVIVFGSFVYDCGHDVDKGGKTEIHPPRGVVAIRKMVAADASNHGGLGTVLLNRADIYFTSRRTRAYCGGFCEHGEPPFVPLGDQNYEFDLPLPSNGASGATLIWWTEEHHNSHGMAVKPEITLVGSGRDAHLHVNLPYKGKSGPLHTATSIYYGWSRTVDSDLRAFKVKVHGIDIYDNAERSDGEWHVWVDINGQWFDLRAHAPGIADAGDEYYPTNKDLVSYVILPNSASSSIRVRALGFESDCADDLYGIADLFPKAIVGDTDPLGALKLITGLMSIPCLLDDNDVIQKFTKVFDKSKGFGVGVPKVYKAEGNQDGQYGLKLSIIEQPGPFQFSSMKVSIGDPEMTHGGMIFDGKCSYWEYQDSQEITFDRTGGGYVKARAAYDQDALYVCIDTNSLFYGEQAVIYLDPGNPSNLWYNRYDDLRISYQINPVEYWTAHFFNPASGWYTKTVGNGEIMVKSVDLWNSQNIEFRITKNLIQSGPWSSKNEQIILNKGIGVLLAIEKGTATRMGAWPRAAYPTVPEDWGRMVFLLNCPITFEAKRIGDILDIGPEDLGTVSIGGVDNKTNNIGDQATVVLDYKINFDHPRCNLKNGKLKANWPSKFLNAEAWTEGGTFIPEGDLFDEDVIKWLLPATREGKYSFTLKQTEVCSDRPPSLNIGTAGGTLTTSFYGNNIPPISISRSVDICEVHSIPRPPIQLKSRCILGPFYCSLYDPSRFFFADPPDKILMKVRNRDNIAQRFVVKAMQVPAGVSNADPGANLKLDFSKATSIRRLEVPPRTTVAFRFSLNMRMRSQLAVQTANDNFEAVAVQIVQEDAWVPPITAVRQLIPYTHLIPGQDNVLPVTIWNTVREPADLYLQVVSSCSGWETRIEPNMLPAQAPGNSTTVQVHIRPPEESLLGSGCSIDIIAWSEIGEFVGKQRILDLPPLQFSPDQLPFASSEIDLEPENPEPGDQVRTCAVIRNRANTTIHGDVLLGMSDRLSTAPEIDEYFSVPVDVPPGGISRVCTNPFVWTGDRSFEAIIRQAGYQNLSIQRNVGKIPENGSILLEVRNPLTTTEVINLTYKPVGLPDWQVIMPEAVTLGPGETVNVEVKLIPPGLDIRPGDEGIVEIYTHTPDSQVIGGAWVHVWSSAEVKTHIISLRSGWNLISVPINLTTWQLGEEAVIGNPLNVTPTNCLSSIYRYNTNTGLFEKSDHFDNWGWWPATGSENFTSLEPGRGYWVMAQQDCSLTFTGTEPSDLNVPLDSGWNLIGWYSMNEAELGEEAVVGNPLNVTPANSLTSIYRYNTTSGLFEKSDHFEDYGWWPATGSESFTELEPGRGYWVMAKNVCKWWHEN